MGWHRPAQFVKVTAVCPTGIVPSCRLPLAIASFLILVAVTLFGAPQQSVASVGPDELRVYVSLPRQGDNAPTSRLIVKGLKAALEEREGRVGGRPVRLVQLNDAVGPRWNAARVRSNARRAIDDPQAVAYVGQLNSEASAVAQPILTRAGMAMFAPVSTATSLTDLLATPGQKPALFRSIPTDADQGDALVAYLKRAGIRRFALVEDGALYGQGLALTVAAVARSRGIRLVATRRASRDGRNHATLAKSLARMRPEAVLFAGSLSSGAVRLFKALHRRMPRALLFGGDALAHRAFARRLGPVQSRIRLTAPAANIRPPRAHALGLGAQPDPVTVFSYEGMAALLGAIERSGVSDSNGDPADRREAIRAAIFDGTVNSRLLGPWRVEPTGDSSIRTFTAIRLRGGHLLDRGRLVARPTSRR